MKNKINEYLIFFLEGILRDNNNQLKSKNALNNIH